jgi:copper chaperone CopZ
MLLEVRTMTCNHCVVTAAIHALDPSASVAVDLGRGTVRIDGDGTEVEAAVAAIRDEGYDVRVLEP